MSRNSISEIDGSDFDVAVIGAGVNGCNTAQQLAAAGYRTLLVDKGDFAAGSSGRSSRLLHCGLRYLAPGASMFEFLRHPGRFKTACSMARTAMTCRRDFVRDSPERVAPFDLHYPVWRDSLYKPWQVALAFRLLAALGPKEVPLDHRALDPATVKRSPLVAGLRDMDRLLGVTRFREYRFEWPERIVMDAVLDAQRLGAVARNYTAVTGLDWNGTAWRLRLADRCEPGAGEAPVEATVEAAAIVNMAGIWIDQVNALAGPGPDTGPRRKITGTKGSHILVRLPPDCQTSGVATTHRENEPFYCIPWRGLHYFGPTETLYEGDLDSIRPEEAEIEWLLGEANHLLPGLNLKRGDVRGAWSGVRPLTYDPAQPRGARARELHDLLAEGMPNAWAMTAGPIMTHRSAGALISGALAGKVAPRGAAPRGAAPRGAAPRGAGGLMTHTTQCYGQGEDSPPLLNDWPVITLADLEAMAEAEQVTSLIDLLVRRAGVVWTESQGEGVAETAAHAVADTLGWDEARIAREVAAYRAYLARYHKAPGV